MANQRKSNLDLIPKERGEMTNFQKFWFSPFFWYVFWGAFGPPKTIKYEKIQGNCCWKLSHTIWNANWAQFQEEGGREKKIIKKNYFTLIFFLGFQGGLGPPNPVKCVRIGKKLLYLIQGLYVTFILITSETIPPFVWTLYMAISCSLQLAKPGQPSQQ